MGHVIIDHALFYDIPVYIDGVFIDDLVVGDLFPFLHEDE